MSTPKTTSRTSYHHGDLRNAMIDSAVDLARTGGPEAVVLREVARRVGVSATAAYRHFADAESLLEEVKRSALEGLADSLAGAVIHCPVGDALSSAVAAHPGSHPDSHPDSRSAKGDAGDLAVARLRAAANAYIDFAIEQPGLFMTAFCRTTTPGEVYEGEPFAETSAFQSLGALLDQVVETGRMPAERRPGAEIAAWSVVHGFALLLVGGPLERYLSAEQQEFVRQRTLEVVIRGLTAAE